MIAWVSQLLFLQGSSRIFLLTKNNFVLADQKTGQVKASVPLPDLTSVSVSTQNDGFFALKLKEVRNQTFTIQYTKTVCETVYCCVVVILHVNEM